MKTLAFILILTTLFTTIPCSAQSGLAAQAVIDARRDCNAIGNLDHCLNQDCDIRTISLKGASDGETKKIHSRI